MSRSSIHDWSTILYLYSEDIITGRLDTKLSEISINDVTMALRFQLYSEHLSIWSSEFVKLFVHTENLAYSNHIVQHEFLLFFLEYDRQGNVQISVCGDGKFHGSNDVCRTGSVHWPNKHGYVPVTQITRLSFVHAGLYANLKITPTTTSLEDKTKIFTTGLAFQLDT